MATEAPDRLWREWRARIEAATQPLIDEALQAGKAADRRRCAGAAHAVAAAYLSGYRQAGGSALQVVRRAART